VRTAVADALHDVPEPYQTAVILRDLEDMSYDEIAEVLQISLGTVKSRITRGRQALRMRLSGYVREVGEEMGLAAPEQNQPKGTHGSRDGREVEVTP
jgi:RNA polymerase sigma-70 factor (ECF subfamily)